MKTLFVLSLVCALLSLLAVVGFSAMSVVPGPGVERQRGVMMLVGAAFFVGWAGLAFWLRPRRWAARRSLPQWSTGLLIAVSVVYALGVCSIFIG